MPDRTQYIRWTGLGWDLLMDMTCPDCRRVHPVKVNELMGPRDPAKRADAEKRMVEKWHYVVIASLAELDKLTGRCEPEPEEEEEEEEDDL